MLASVFSYIVYNCYLFIIVGISLYYRTWLIPMMISSNSLCPQQPTITFSNPFHFSKSILPLLPHWRQPHPTFLNHISSLSHASRRRWFLTQCDPKADPQVLLENNTRNYSQIDSSLPVWKFQVHMKGVWESKTFDLDIDKNEVFLKKGYR